MTAPTIRMPRPGPGNGWRQTIALGHAELEADLAHLVLEQHPQRLDQLELQVVRQAADVVVALDVRRAGAAAGLDHVGVERALHEELDRVPLGVGGADDVARRLLEDADELAADDLALLLGVGDPVERGEELLAGVDDDQVDAGRRDELLLDLLGLTGPQQPVVDEHAGQLVADGALHQRGGHGGVDTTGQGAQHPALADLLADRGDLVLDHVGRGPRAVQPGAAQQEVLDHPLAEGRVDHLGVPLDAVQPALVVLERGDVGARGGRGDLHPGGSRGHRVAVGHPHRLGRRSGR